MVGARGGLSIGFSMLALALFIAYVPDLPGAAIIEPLGYSVGFLIVILSRQQLFTENTLTAVLPVMARRKWDWVWVLLRLWGIVLAGNLVGCFLFPASLLIRRAVAGHDQGGARGRRPFDGQFADARCS